MTISSKIVRRVATIDESRSVLDAAKFMTEEFIGSVVVTNPSGIRGLFTERELMMNVVGKGKDPEKVRIKDVLAGDPLKVSPNDTASACLDLMKGHRCRHSWCSKETSSWASCPSETWLALMIDEEELIQHLERYIAS